MAYISRIYTIKLLYPKEVVMASKREQITLQSSKSSYRYRTTKNKTTVPGRLSLMKYDPILRQKVEFKETK